MPEYEIAPELVRNLANLESGLSAAMAEVKRVIDSFAERAKTILPALREGVRRLEYWDEQEGNLLREYVGAQGLIVPLSLMSFPAFAELITAHEQGGGPAVVVRLRQYYDEIFRSTVFLEHRT
jgi:hypothetical protein